MDTQQAKLASQKTMKTHAQIDKLRTRLSGGRHPLVASVLLLLGVGLAPAQTNWSLTQPSLVSGGGVCTNGPITLRVTLGQTATGGPVTGGGFSLTAGFWAGAAVVQTPGAPLLNLTRAGASVVLSWPGPATGYVLQQSPAIANGNWTDINLTPVDNAGTRSVTLPLAPGNWFFRLRK